MYVKIRSLWYMLYLQEYLLHFAEKIHFWIFDRYLIFCPPVNFHREKMVQKVMHGRKKERNTSWKLFQNNIFFPITLFLDPLSRFFSIVPPRKMFRKFFGPD